MELHRMAPKSGSLKSVSGEKILQSIQNSVKTIQICKRKVVKATVHTDYCKEALCALCENFHRYDIRNASRVGHEFDSGTSNAIVM